MPAASLQSSVVRPTNGRSNHDREESPVDDSDDGEPAARPLCHVAAVGAAARASRAADGSAATAHSASAAQQRRTASITITVVSDDGTGVRNARVSLMATGAGAGSRRRRPAAGRPLRMRPLRSPPVNRRADEPDRRATEESSALRQQARTDSGGRRPLATCPRGVHAVSVIAPPGYVSRARRRASSSARVAGPRDGEVVARRRRHRARARRGRLPTDGRVGLAVSRDRRTRPMSTAPRRCRPTTSARFACGACRRARTLVAAHYDDRVGTVSGEGAPLGGYLVARLPGARPTPSRWTRTSRPTFPA